MKKLVQINPVLRVSTSTGRIMQEIGDIAMNSGWESYIAYSRGRDGEPTVNSRTLPVGTKLDVALHGIATRLFDRHGLASREATREFVRRLEALHPDVVHIHNIHGYFLNYEVLFDYLRASGVPVVWTVHDCWLYTGHCYYYTSFGCDKWERGCGNCPQKRSFPASWLFDRSAQNFADKRRAFTSLRPGQLTIVPVSDWIRREMSRSFLAGCNFQVIHNGINTDVFTPSADHSGVRERYGLADKKILLGVASIWSAEKGIDDFRQMAEMLAPDEVIVLVGVPPELRRTLPPKMVGIGRTDNIGQLAELYSAAEAFINPTRQDNYPTVNLESISSGTPVVTYRTGGSVESITPMTGAIVECGDVKGLLDSARSFMKIDRGELAAKCREYALANFRKEDRYADYLKLYEKITSAAPSD